jgi:hypothetical protein
VCAPRTQQNRLCLLQTYKGVVESAERHYYSSSCDDRKLRQLLTSRLCSRRHSRLRRGSGVRRRLWSVAPHVQCPQQRLNVQKALSSYSNRTGRQQLTHRTALWPCQHSGRSSRSPTYSYISTFLAIDQSIGFGRAPDYILVQKMLHIFAIFLHSGWKNNQWHIYHSPRDRTPFINYRRTEKQKGRKLTLKRTNDRTYNQTYNRVFRDTYDRIYKSTYFFYSQV